MDTTLLKIVSASLFFLFIFISGFWLSHSGKPYSSLIFNIHKLIGLAGGIFLGVTVFQAHKVTPLGPAQISAVVITVLLLVINIAAGGLISIEAAGDLKSINKAMRTAISRIHKIFPYLAVLSTAITLYLLLVRN